MLLSQTNEFIKEPFCLKLSFKNELKSFLVVCVLIALILLLINPISGNNKALPFLGFFIVAFVAFLINNGLNFYLIPNFNDISQWTIGKEISRRVLNLVIFSILMCLYYVWVFEVNFELVIKFFVLSLIIGLIAITYKLSINRSVYLKGEQVAILKSNKLLYKKLDAIREGELSFVSNVTKETLTINKSQLLFIEADGNYTVFNVIKNNELQTIVFRCNLKNIEKQIDKSFLIRCHRSYILNLTHPIQFKRKNKTILYAHIDDYKLKIPVSRTQYGIVKESHERLRVKHL